MARQPNLHRTLEASFLNEVANHDEVRPWLGNKGALDLSSLVENPANVALVSERGGFVFHRVDAARYEVHTLFLPSGHGGFALECARDAARYMFTSTDCMEIITRTPAENKAAIGLTRAMGFARTFELKGAWEGQDLFFWSLNFDQWIARDSEVEATGHRFHEILEAQKAKAGSERPTHPDIEAHDRAAGAAMFMAEAGMAAKAVWSYNRWASVAGFETIELVSERPPIIDVRDAVIAVTTNGLEFLKCR